MARFASRLNITHKFALFLLVTSLIPLLVAGLTAYFVSRAVVRQEATRYTAELVENQKDYLELELQQVENLIANISSTDAIASALEEPQASSDTYTDLATQARINYILEGYTHLDGLVSIDIFTLTGAHYHVGDTLDFSEIRTGVRDQIFVEALNSDQQIYWTGIADNVNINSTYPKVLTAAKVLRKLNLDTLQADPIALLMVNYSAEHLHNRFQSLNLGEGAYLNIVDTQNRIIYHPDPRLIGTRIDPNLISQFSGMEGTFMADSGRGTLVTYSQSPLSGWWMISFVPVNTLLAPTAMIGSALAIAAVAALLFVALFVWILTKRTVVPVQQITQRFQALQSGSLSEDLRMPDYGEDEIGQLVNWFNTYLDSLKNRQQAEQALRSSEERFRTLVENLRDWIWQVDERGVFTYTSRNAEQMVGYKPEELHGKSPVDLMPDDEKDQYTALFTRAVSAQERLVGLEIHLIHKNGACCEFEMNGVPLFDRRGRFIGYGGTLRDITLHKKAEVALRESEERYALAASGANDGIWDWDMRANRVFFSPRWKNMLGYHDSEIGDSASEWFGRVHPEDIDQLKAEIATHLEGITERFQSEHRIFHKSGRYRWVMAQGVAVREEGQKPHRMAGSLTDISARKATEERLRHDAMHDPLTNLPNRAYFMDQLRRSIERARRHNDYMAAVLFMDLDRFKIVNDSLGHGSGDTMLIAIAHRLEASLRAGDIVARFGGDEFAVLLDDINSVNDAILVANRIQKELSMPFTLQGVEVFTSASIGIALTTPNYNRPEDLLRDADTAMYRAKASGRARHQIFDSEMHARSLALLQLEAELRRAIDRQEFELFYQPVVSLVSGQVTTVEALLRWNHPTRGLLFPKDFMGLAEETGLIVTIGEWALRQACLQMKHWQDDGHVDIRVAVNISVRQFQDPNLRELVNAVLCETGLPGECLQIEITESAAMQDFDVTTQTIHELSRMGVLISIDDFGTSYSSLGYLKRFPVSGIKIDQTFIRDIIDDLDDAAITTAIIAIGHILNLNVVAEGVETEKQLDFSTSQNCDEIQGYLLDHPMPADEFTARLNDGTLHEYSRVSR